MRVYLGSPISAAQQAAAADMPVLLSYAAFAKRSKLGRVHSFERVLIDSGAFSEMNTPGLKVDLEAYFDWAAEIPWADAVAGLDDITGDWRRSLKNYERGGFPTFHDTDPPELLDDLIHLARGRGGWIGLGLAPPRHGKREFVCDTLDKLPRDLHVHGFALGLYASTCPRIDSIDSTNWFWDAMKVKRDLPWLTYDEALEIIVKRIRRRERNVPGNETEALPLFPNDGTSDAD